VQLVSRCSHSSPKVHGATEIIANPRSLDSLLPDLGVTVPNFLGTSTSPYTCPHVTSIMAEDDRMVRQKDLSELKSQTIDTSAT
jgi:hypothetical protein